MGMSSEIINKTYQFSEGDTFVIIHVDCFKRKMKVKVPFLFRFSRGPKYWEWLHVKNLALDHLKKQYGFQAI